MSNISFRASSFPGVSMARVAASPRFGGPDAAGQPTTPTVPAETPPPAETAPEGPGFFKRLGTRLWRFVTDLGKAFKHLFGKAKDPHSFKHQMKQQGALVDKLIADTNVPQEQKDQRIREFEEALQPALEKLQKELGVTPAPAAAQTSAGA